MGACFGVLMRSVCKRKRLPCSVCKGSKIIKSEKRRKLFNQPGLIMPERRYGVLASRSSHRWPDSMAIPGPECAPDCSREEWKPRTGEVRVWITPQVNRLSVRSSGSGRFTRSREVIASARMT